MTDRSKAGRPTKLTPALQEKIVMVIRGGNYIETAAAYAGISKQTLYNWLRRGARQKSGQYREFALAVEQALAEAEMRDLALIEQAARDGKWQAAAWRLERRFPKRWGRQDYLDLLMQERQTQVQAKKKQIKVQLSPSAAEEE
jgi:transposase